MKKNYKSILRLGGCIVAVLIMATFLILKDFDYVGRNFLQSIENADNKSSIASFYFTPVREKVSSLYVYSMRNNYIEKIDDKYLEIKIFNIENGVETEIAGQKIGLRKFNRENYTKINFSQPLEHVQGKKLMVLINSSTDQNTQEFIKIDTKIMPPRITYRDSLLNIISEGINNMNRDPKFYFCYKLLSCFLLLVTLFSVVLCLAKDHRRGL